MEGLKIKNGLVVIAGINTLNKTSFVVQLANDLAKNENVLFLNWMNYADELCKLIELSNNKINDNLDLYKSLDSFGVASFIKIIELIDLCKYTTVVVDDLNTFTNTGLENDELDQYNTEGKTAAIQAFHFIIDKYNVRVISTLTVENGALSQANIDKLARTYLIESDCSQLITLSDDYDNSKIIDLYSIEENTNSIENHRIYLNANN